MAQMPDRIDCHVDTPSQCVDRSQHFATDIFDDHVAEEDVDARPENDDGQPNLKHLVEEDVLELVSTFFYPLFMEEKIVLIVYLSDLIHRSKLCHLREQIED